MQFVRTLFGSSGRWDKVKNDIKFITNHPYRVDYIVFTYGVDNHNMLLGEGVKSILIHNEPAMFDSTQLWAHKIYCWLKASELYDKFVYLDFDVTPVRPLPDNFDASLANKKLQVSLRKYVNVRCEWRNPRDYVSKLLPCASWIYFGDKNIPKELWELWIQMGKIRREERVLAKYTEVNGVFDINYFWENFEPHGDTDYFHLKRETIYKNRENRGGSLFKHFSSHSYTDHKAIALYKAARRAARKAAQNLNK